MAYLGLIGLLIGVAAIGRWFWRAWGVDVPQKAYPFQAALLVGLLLGVSALYLGHDDPFAPWAIGFAIMFLYFLSTGAQKIGDDSIAVGDSLPAFTAPDDNDDEFDSSSLSGSRVLLKFFRGHW
mgnify:CR=1 FL=1